MASMFRPLERDREPSGLYRILLVDGEIDIQAVLVVLLEVDFLVNTSSTASEGFHCLNAFAPDLVILDIALPDLDGTHFLRTLRARHPACPVLVITASEHAEALCEMATLRIEGFYRKPLRLDKLLEQIQALFPPQRQRQLSTPLYSHYAGKAIEYIGCHYVEPLTVTAVANAISMSASHLAYLFRSAIGMTVKKYLTKVRIEVAKRLLTSTADTLDSIAERVGFCDAPHLSRVFRRHVGYWPGEYRRRSTITTLGPARGFRQSGGLEHSLNHRGDIQEVHRIVQ